MTVTVLPWRARKLMASQRASNAAIEREILSLRARINVEAEKMTTYASRLRNAAGELIQENQRTLEAAARGDDGDVRSR